MKKICKNCGYYNELSYMPQKNTGSCDLKTSEIPEETLKEYGLSEQERGIRMGVQVGEEYYCNDFKIK